jgi:TolA-binding protein
MTRNRIFAMSIIALATLAGCSSQPEKNALLDEARSNYRVAQNDPQARDLAGAEMRQADEAMKLANAASERGDKAADVDHLAYLAKQRVAIAQETGRQKAAEKSVDSAEAGRDKVRLAARTTEADMAHRSADSARRTSDDAQARNRDLEAQLKALNARQTPPRHGDHHRRCPLRCGPGRDQARRHPQPGAVGRLPQDLPPAQSRH